MVILGDRRPMICAARLVSMIYIAEDLKQLYKAYFIWNGTDWFMWLPEGIYWYHVTEVKENVLEVIGWEYIRRRQNYIS